MNPKIVAKEEMHFAGITDTFISIHSPNANNFVVIPALWGRFHEVCEAVKEPADDIGYGLVICEEGGSRPDELRYIAAMRVSEPWAADGDLVGYTAPAATYAIIEHRGPIANLGETLRAFGEWLDGSDYIAAAGAEIEAYGDDFDPESDDSVMETWIPVTPK